MIATNKLTRAIFAMIMAAVIALMPLIDVQARTNAQASTENTETGEEIVIVKSDEVEAAEDLPYTLVCPHVLEKIPPSPYSFEAAVGSTKILEQIVTFQQVYPGNVSYESVEIYAEEGEFPEWFSLTPQALSGPGSLTFLVDPSGLAPGTYTTFPAVRFEFPDGAIHCEGTPPAGWVDYLHAQVFVSTVSLTITGDAPCPEENPVTFVTPDYVVAEGDEVVISIVNNSESETYDAVVLYGQSSDTTATHPQDYGIQAIVEDNGIPGAVKAIPPGDTVEVYRVMAQPDFELENVELLDFSVRSICNKDPIPEASLGIVDCSFGAQVGTIPAPPLDMGTVFRYDVTADVPSSLQTNCRLPDNLEVKVKEPGSKHDTQTARQDSLLSEQQDELPLGLGQSESVEFKHVHRWDWTGSAATSCAAAQAEKAGENALKGVAAAGAGAIIKSIAAALKAGEKLQDVIQDVVKASPDIWSTVDIITGDSDLITSNEYELWYQLSASVPRASVSLFKQETLGYGEPGTVTVVVPKVKQQAWTKFVVLSEIAWILAGVGVSTSETIVGPVIFGSATGELVSLACGVYPFAVQFPGGSQAASLANEPGYQEKAIVVPIDLPSWEAQPDSPAKALMLAWAQAHATHQALMTSMVRYEVAQQAEDAEWMQRHLAAAQEFNATYQQQLQDIAPLLEDYIQTLADEDVELTEADLQAAKMRLSSEGLPEEFQIAFNEYGLTSEEIALFTDALIATIEQIPTDVPNALRAQLVVGLGASAELDEWLAAHLEESPSNDAAVWLPLIAHPAECQGILINEKVWNGTLTTGCDASNLVAGEPAFKMHAATPSIAEVYSPLIAVTPNTRYQVSYQVKTDLTVDGAELYGRVVAAQYTSAAVEQDTVDKNRIDAGFGLGESVGGQTDWTSKSYTFTTGPDTAYVRLRALLGGPVGTATGSMWLRDVAIRED